MRERDPPRPIFRSADWPRSDPRVPTLADVTDCLQAVSRMRRKQDADDFMRSEGLDPDRVAAYAGVVERLEEALMGPITQPLGERLAETARAVFAGVAFALALLASEDGDLA